MPEGNSDSLIPRPGGDLSVPGEGADRILSEMASDALAVQKEGLKKGEVEPGTLLFTHEFVDIVSSSPAIGLDGSVYIGSGELESGKVHSIDGRTGDKKWEFTTGGFVRSSPAIGSDGTVYVGSWDTKLYALDGKTGNKRWEFETGDRVFSSPAIGVDGTVYVGSYDKKVYALDGSSGAKKWEFETEAQVGSSPSIGTDGTVYFGSDRVEDGKLYALDGKSGAKKWEFRGAGGTTATPSIGADGTVYFEAYGHMLYALDGEKGSKIWEYKRESFSPSRNLAIGEDNTIYGIQGFASNWAFALDGKSGTKIWEFGEGFIYGSDSSPAIGADGNIHFGFDSGDVYCVDGKTGREKWVYETSHSIHSCPSIGPDGIVYIGSGNKLYAINTASKGLANSPWPMFGQNPQPGIPRFGE